jgi:hypothetical protein
MNIPGFEELTLQKDTRVTLMDGHLTVYGSNKEGFDYGKDKIINYADSVDIKGKTITGTFKIKDITVRDGILSIKDNGYLLEKGMAMMREDFVVSTDVIKKYGTKSFTFQDQDVFLTTMDESKIPKDMYENYISYNGKLVMNGRIALKLMPGSHWGANLVENENDKLNFYLFEGRASLENGKVDISFPKPDMNQKVVCEDGENTLIIDPDWKKGTREYTQLGGEYNSAPLDITIHSNDGKEYYGDIDNDNNFRGFDCTKPGKLSLTGKVTGWIVWSLTGMVAGEGCNLVTNEGITSPKKSEAEAKKLLDRIDPQNRAAAKSFSEAANGYSTMAKGVTDPEEAKNLRKKAEENYARAAENYGKAGDKLIGKKNYAGAIDAFKSAAQAASEAGDIATLNSIKYDKLPDIYGSLKKEEDIKAFDELSGSLDNYKNQARSASTEEVTRETGTTFSRDEQRNDALQAAALTPTQTFHANLLSSIAGGIVAGADIDNLKKTLAAGSEIGIQGLNEFRRNILSKAINNQELSTAEMKLLENNNDPAIIWLKSQGYSGFRRR